MSFGSLSELRRVNQHYRALLGAREVAAMRQIANAYSIVWDSLDRRVVDLAESIGHFDHPGEVPARLFRMEQYRSLQTDLATHMDELGDYVDVVVSDEQRFGIHQGRERALRQIEAVYGDIGREMASLNRLPNSALADMVGNTQAGSPLRSLLDELGPDAAQRIERGLIEGIALTLNPREVARNVRDSFGGNMARSLTVSRTELLRATRESAHRHYQENSHAVAGWIWLASLDDRCCMACVYMHGTPFSLEESFDSHPNCRCTNSPVPPNSRVVDMIEAGPDWFERQPEDIKLRMMGPAKYQAYSEKLIDLSQLVHVSHDDRWGTMRREASLVSILNQEDYRRIRRGPARDTPIPVSRGPEMRQRLQEFEANRETLYQRQAELVQQEHDLLRRLPRNDADWQEIRENVPEEMDELLGYQRQLEEVRAELDQHQDELLHGVKRIVQVDDPITLHPSIVQKRYIELPNGDVELEFLTPDPRVERRIEGAYEEFGRLTNNQTMHNSTLRANILGDDYRASYSRNNDEISLSPKDFSGTVVHEIGHALENRNPDILARSVEFYERRTAGFSDRLLSDVTGNPAYMDSELTKVDHFREPYAGKAYRDRETGEILSTELVSLGVQQMYEDPIRFAQEDPEWFDFTVDILRS